jgi:putative dehydrogenase
MSGEGAAGIAIRGQSEEAQAMDEGSRSNAIVGVVGLGSMGGCLARRLLAAGRTVIGYDPHGPALEGFADLGGSAAADVADLAARADMLILALPSVGSFRETVETLVAHQKPGGWVLDINTLLPAEKVVARDRLAPSGWKMLDCTISGTPEMVAADTHSFYVSGGGCDTPEVAALVAQIAARAFDMGEFGNAATIKLIINHMVIAHNVVAAEAMSLAIHAGMDPARVYETVAASAGSSRIFELRGRMMVAEAYPDAAMYALIVDKDSVLIADMARELRHPVPMLSAAVQQHVSAMAQGWTGKDPASLCSMMEGQAGVTRRPR